MGGAQLTRRQRLLLKPSTEAIRQVLQVTFHRGRDIANKHVVRSGVIALLARSARKPGRAICDTGKQGRLGLQGVTGFRELCKELEKRGFGHLVKQVQISRVQYEFGGGTARPIGTFEVPTRPSPTGECTLRIDVIPGDCPLLLGGEWMKLQGLVGDTVRGHTCWRRRWRVHA